MNISFMYILRNVLQHTNERHANKTKHVLLLIKSSVFFSKFYSGFLFFRIYFLYLKTEEKISE
jgi:hypothetical protein